MKFSRQRRGSSMRFRRLQHIIYTSIGKCLEAKKNFYFIWILNSPPCGKWGFFVKKNQVRWSSHCAIAICWDTWDISIFVISTYTVSRLILLFRKVGILLIWLLQSEINRTSKYKTRSDLGEEWDLTFINGLVYPYPRSCVSSHLKHFPGCSKA